MSLSEKEIADLKQQLLSRYSELRKLVREELERSDHAHYRDLAGQVHDAGEEAVADLLVDVELAVIDQHVEELKEIETALKRIDAGVYGQCVDCGADIGLERLKIQPTASRCIVCQEKAEQQAETPSL